MRGILLLAWRYMTYNRLKTSILVACITITMFLPIAVQVLISHYNKELIARAKATPFVLGAKGNRYDLVLKTLYFRAGRIDPVAMGDFDEILDGGLGTPIPIHARYTARKAPIIGTTLDYFEFRGLKTREGSLPLKLGDATIGGKVAKRLGINSGDHMFSDQRNLYDISTTYPLKMRVAGVLEIAGTPDDDAVFVDIKTAWIIDGIGHGHQDLKKTDDPTLVLDRTDENVVGSAAVIEYQEVTPENIQSFHFHAAPKTLPLSSIIVVPHDAKSATILKARINQSTTRQMLVPEEVVQELMGIVLKVKRFLDANFATVALCTGLFVVLVIMLSLRIRKREMETMFKIGCSRMTVFWLQASEMAIILVASVVLAVALSSLLVLLAPSILRIS